jgi:urease accessory protein
MISISDALLSLQVGDTAFPSGAFTFSWGLEGLALDGLVETKQDVIEIIEHQLFYRWNSMDRILLVRAYSAKAEEELQAHDLLADASTPSSAMRQGSRQAGRRLLGVCARLGLARVSSYRDRVLHTPGCGHLPIVQGLVLNEMGLSLAGAEMVSAWGLISGQAAAAVRLGLISHIEAQDVLSYQRAVLAQILAETVDVTASPSSFIPLVDIAVERSGERHVRIFAN